MFIVHVVVSWHALDPTEAAAKHADTCRYKQHLLITRACRRFYACKYKSCFAMHMCPALRVCSAETATGCYCSHQGCRHSHVIFLTLVPSLAIDQRALCTRAQLSGNHGRSLCSQSNKIFDIWGPKQHSVYKAWSKWCPKHIYVHIMYTAHHVHHAEYQVASATIFSSYFMTAGFCENGPPAYLPFDTSHAVMM